MTQTKKPLIGLIGGTSQFGQWFKFFFESCGCQCLVAGRKTALTPLALAKRADIVIVSVPIRETVKMIRSIRTLVKPGALLCDFTSLKTEPLREMLISDKAVGVLGIHPLFGPLVPSLVGQNIIFCPGRHNAWVDFLKNIFESKGGKVIELSSEEHDKQMALIQALTHFTNIAFAGVMRDQKIQPRNVLSTPVFRLQSMLAARVLGSNPSLYADIEIRNPAFRGVLKQFIAEVENLGAIVASGNEANFENEFKSIAAAMENFIPIAQTKLSEIMYLIDKQPVEMNKNAPYSSAARAGTAVACLGPEGTFSHGATKEIFPKEKDLTFTTTIKQVFKAVHNREAEYGVVPIENSVTGLVRETLDAIMDYPLKVIGSRKLAIHHQLLSRTNDPKAIRIIRSKIEPLGQCREYLAKNFPQAVLEPQASSTQAIMATADPSVAFIGSRAAAKEYGLTVMAEDIEDGKHNETEFYVIAKGDRPKMSRIFGANKALVILAVYDRPGVLRDILSVFADGKLNLTKLHSHRSLVKGWDYYFFLELDAKPGSKNFKTAIKKVKTFCSVVRVLGTA